MITPDFARLQEFNHVTDIYIYIYIYRERERERERESFFKCKRKPYKKKKLNRVVLLWIKIYRTIIWPVVLYGCETWLLTLRAERWLMVFENRVLRRIFGPKRDDVTGDWGKLHNEELSDLYSSPNIIRMIKSRRMRWAGHAARMGGEKRRIQGLVGKPEGKRPF